MDSGLWLSALLGVGRSEQGGVLTRRGEWPTLDAWRGVPDSSQR